MQAFGIPNYAGILHGTTIRFRDPVSFILSGWKLNAIIAREGAMNAESDVRVVNVFISSPADVAPERGRVQVVADKLNREFGGLCPT
jgi:hypothetical protein